jgi:hypothetical protein
MGVCQQRIVAPLIKGVEAGHLESAGLEARRSFYPLERHRCLAQSARRENASLKVFDADDQSVFPERRVGGVDSAQPECATLVRRDAGLWIGG